MDQVMISSEESAITSKMRSVKRSRGLGYVTMSLHFAGNAELSSLVL